jgi:hypothetical protein
VSLALANQVIDAERRLAVRVAELVYEQLPELAERYGAAGKARCEEDTALHLRFVASALATGEPRIIADYLAWLAPLLERFRVPREDLDRNLDAIEAAVRELVPAAGDRVAALLAEARGD